MDGVLHLPQIVAGKCVGSGAPIRHEVVLRDGFALRVQTTRPPKSAQVRSALSQDLRYALANAPMSGMFKIFDRTAMSFSSGWAAETAARVGEALGSTALTSDLKQLAAFVAKSLQSDEVKTHLEAQLCWGGSRGADLLDSWQGASTVTGTTSSKAVRAFPTRQLHITAGNSMIVPVLSAIYGLMVKGVLTVKTTPATSVGAALFALAIAREAGEHALGRALTVLLWRSGDASVTTSVVDPKMFDCVVGWGTDATLKALRERFSATPARFISFGPHCPAIVIGTEALNDDGQLIKVAGLAAKATLPAADGACDAPVLHFVEGDVSQANRYAATLRAWFAHFDAASPRRPTLVEQWRWKSVRRGLLINADWFVNGEKEAPTSSIAVTTSPFDYLQHPGGRCVVVRPVTRLADVMAELRSDTGYVAVYPNDLVMSLSDHFAAAGVFAVHALGGAPLWPGAPMEKRNLLGDLVTWVSVSGAP